MSKKSIIITVSVIGGILILLLILSAIGSSKDKETVEPPNNLSGFETTSVSNQDNSVSQEEFRENTVTRVKNADFGLTDPSNMYV